MRRDAKTIHLSLVLQSGGDQKYIIFNIYTYYGLHCGRAAL